VVGIAALIVAALLVVFAVELAHTQTTTRDAVETRFRDRARVTSALTEALFASLGSSTENARLYGGADVDDADMARAQRTTRLEYAVLLDENGSVIARSPGFDAAAAARLAKSAPHIRAVLDGRPVTVSDVIPGREGESGVVEFAQGFRSARDGRRVLVSATSPAALHIILNSYLSRIPLRSGGTAYVVDTRGAVIAGRDGNVVPGAVVDEEGLAAAIDGDSAGPYGENGYFAAEPVRETPWRVVLTADEDQLFESISGGRKWVPWMIFGGFAIAAFAALFLLHRTLASRAALQRLNADLQTANTQLEGRNALLLETAELARSNAELEQFASIASHDLQEPLRKVQTFAAQLNAHERDNLTDEGKDYLRRMSDAASRMRLLIDDLLVFSRVSTKGRPFEEVDLGEVAAQVLTDLEVAIDEAGATVTVDDLPTIEADRTQMRQLLQNLIANALKFRREGVAPEIHLTGSTTDVKAEVTVSDNGIGIEPQYASRIFRAFERLHSRHEYPGTGIGLALCRKIVERHHGTITATGTPGAGAEFTFALPIEQHTDGTPAGPDFVPDHATHARV
jgi:signal transduction histidine kinase